MSDDRQTDPFGAIHAVRELLNANGVPEAAFIDDHVVNLIIQRDEARAEVERLRSDVEKALDAANYEANRNSQPAAPTDEDREAVAAGLWHQFSPDHELDFRESPHQDEYRHMADAAPPPPTSEETPQ